MKEEGRKNKKKPQVLIINNLLLPQSLICHFIVLCNLTKERSIFPKFSKLCSKCTKRLLSLSKYEFCAF